MFAKAQVDVAAPKGSEAAIQQIRAVLSAAVAGAGAADGLPTKQHAHVSMPLVSSEAQVCFYTTAPETSRFLIAYLCPTDVVIC